MLKICLLLINFKFDSIIGKLKPERIYMKKLLIIAIMAIPLTSLPQTVYYAPSKYTCSEQNNACVCLQTDNNYFPVRITLPNDCKNQGTMIFPLMHVSEYPKTSGRKSDVVAQYANYLIQVQPLISLAADTSNSNWEWTPNANQCRTNGNPQICPLISAN